MRGTTLDVKPGTTATLKLKRLNIAERLYLSVRTVDNHLQRSYTKLGVSGRSELSDALGRAGVAAP